MYQIPIRCRKSDEYYSPHHFFNRQPNLQRTQIICTASTIYVPKHNVSNNMTLMELSVDRAQHTHLKSVVQMIIYQPFDNKLSFKLQ